MTTEEYLLVEARIKKEKEKLVNLEKELKRHDLWPKIIVTELL